MKYSKKELINRYANKLLQNENFVNHWMKERFSFYDCYVALTSENDSVERKDYTYMITTYLMARAKEELNVLLVGFDVEQMDGCYNWTDERYIRVCHWLDELTEREE